MMTEQSGIRKVDLAERPSAIHELQALIKRALPKEGEEPRVKDPTNEALELKQEFVDLVALLNLPFVVTLMPCEGDLYMLVLSEFRLDGGTRPTDTESELVYTEFEDHKWNLRTYGYTQAENEHASWTVLTELAQYKYIVETPTKLAFLGYSREKVKIAPIVWVSASDGQCAMQDDTMRRADDRELPSYRDTLQAQLAYGVNVASKLLETNKILAQQSAEDKQSDKDKAREWAYLTKEAIKKGLEMSHLIGKAMRGGIGGYLVSIFPNGMKDVLKWILILMGLYLCLAFVLSLWGVPVPFLDFGDAGGTTTIPDGGQEAVTGPVVP